MTSITVTELKENLSKYLNLAIENNATIKIKTSSGNAIILSEDEYNKLTEMFPKE